MVYLRWSGRFKDGDDWTAHRVINDFSKKKIILHRRFCFFLGPRLPSRSPCQRLTEKERGFQQVVGIWDVFPVKSHGREGSEYGTSGITPGSRKFRKVVVWSPGCSRPSSAIHSHNLTSYKLKKVDFAHEGWNHLRVPLAFEMKREGKRPCLPNEV